MTVQTELTVADVLYQAADLIDAEGLWQGDCTPGGQTAGHCPVTAIMEITATTPALHRPSVDALQASLGFGSVSDVFWWNDAAPTVEVVTSQLRRAAQAQDPS